jgi:hypothetical protein
MNSFVLALRAIGTHLAMRLYIPAVVIVSVWVALLVATGLWLTTFSNWWWLLLIPITSFACIALGVALVVLALIRFVRPTQTSAQRKAVTQFTDKLQAIAETIGTPKVIILFHVVRSIAAPSKDTYLANLVAHKTLAHDFRDLQRSFEDGAVIE